MPRGSRATVQRARELRSEPTDAERRLWMQLRGRQIDGHRFRRPGPIGPYVVDFAAALSRLVIEVDGRHHIAAAADDARRTAFLEAAGHTGLRRWDSNVSA